MSKSLPTVDENSDTFFSWLEKTNDLINLANTEIVTANNSANGAITTGKGYVIGTFGANTVVADVIRGGNTVANSAITFVSNASFTGAAPVSSNSGITVGANSAVYDHGFKANTSGTSQQSVDSFAYATYRSAKYVISIKDSSNNFQVTEILLMHDGSNTYSTEYATLVSNNVLSTFTSDINSTNVRLLATPAVSPLELTISRTLIKA